MKAERRVANRKIVEPVYILDLTQLEDYTVIGKLGTLVDASTSGFLLHIHRKDLLLNSLKGNLSLEILHGSQVALFIPQMNLDIDGTIRRTRLLKNGYFEVAIDFSADTPQYWKECLVELLPWPGEIE